MTYFADTAESLATLGVPGLVVVVLALCGVIVYLYKKIDSIQETRLQDARETRDKISEPMQKIADVTERTNELLNDYLTRRRR